MIGRRAFVFAHRYFMPRACEPTKLRVRGGGRKLSYESDQFDRRRAIPLSYSFSPPSSPILPSPLYPPSLRSLSLYPACSFETLLFSTSSSFNVLASSLSTALAPSLALILFLSFAWRFYLALLLLSLPPPSSPVALAYIRAPYRFLRIRTCSAAASRLLFSPSPLSLSLIPS